MFLQPRPVCDLLAAAVLSATAKEVTALADELALLVFCILSSHYFSYLDATLLHRMHNSFHNRKKKAVIHLRAIDGDNNRRSPNQSRC